MTDIQGESSHCEASNEDDLSRGRSNQTPRLQYQEPHTQTETTQKASQSFCEIRKSYRQCPRYQSCDACSDEVGALYAIRDWRMHDVDNEDRDRQAEQVCRREEDV